MPDVKEIFDRVRRTAMMPDPTNPLDFAPQAVRQQQQKKQVDTKRVKYVQYQEAVLLTLESIRRSNTMILKCMKKIIENDEKDDVKGEVFESRIILPPGKPVMQIDFLGADHSNFDPAVNLAPGDDLAIPIHPVKHLIIYNKSDVTINYAANPHYQNLQRVHNEIDPIDLANIPSRPHNIARVNLLNKSSTVTANVKLMAIL